MNRNMIEYFVKKFLKYKKDFVFGNNANKIFEPSSGGIGTKLKMPRKRLTMTIVLNIKALAEDSMLNIARNLNASPKIIAKTKFENAPAMATFKTPHFLSDKFSSTYGTGLAQPNTKPALVIIKIKGKKTDPTGSRCFKGFKVKRPIRFAVWSPKYNAM